MEKEINKIVSIVEFEVDDSYDSDSFLKLKLKVAHDGQCPKGFNFSKESLENAAPTIVNKPILARVVFDSEGNPQFSGHDKHIETDYKKEVRIIYDEVPIGIIPEVNEYKVEYDKNTNTSYAYCYGYIWKKYSNYALDIIERDKDIKLSMEINIEKFKIDSKTKEKIVTQFKYDGITLLGNNRTPGMKNASATTEFDLNSENEVKDENIKEYLHEFISEFKNLITEFDNSKEGGNVQLKEKTEHVEETVDNQNTENFENTEKEETKVVEENHEEPVTDSKENFEAENTSNEETKAEEKEDFELTSNELRNKLEKAVRVLFRKLPNTYGYLQDYDSKYVYYIKEVYTDDTGYIPTSYRRSYEIVDDVATLKDDETETVVKILTKDEWNEIETARESQQVEFEELKQFKAETLEKERKAKLDVVFDKFDKKLDGLDEYKELKENNMDFSIEEIENKCFAICGRMEFDKEPVVEEQSDIIKVDTDVTFENEEASENTSKKSSYCDGILDKYYGR